MLLPDNLTDPPFTDDDLDAYFEWQHADPIGLRLPPELAVDEGWEPRAARWSVQDTGSAEWAMSKLAHATYEAEERRAEAREFRAQIDRWEQGQLAPLERRINFFTGQLEDYARRKREEGQKSVRLPSGEITSRTVPARPEIVKDDEERFINWARALELPLVKAKWSPVMGEVKRLVEWKEVDGAMVAVVDGRPVPGVVLVPESVSFSVKPVRS